MEIEEYVKNILNDIKSGGIDAGSEYWGVLWLCQALQNLLCCIFPEQLS